MGSVPLRRYWSRSLSLVRSVTWNYLGYFVEFLAGLFLLAYVVRRIPIHDYGIYIVAQSLAAFLYLLEFGMGSMLVPLYVSTAARKGMAEVSRLASTAFVALLSAGAAGAVLLSVGAGLLPRWMGFSSADMALGEKVLAVTSAAAALALPHMVLEQLCQAFHRFDRVNQLQIAAVALRVALTVGMLAAGKGIVALALVQVAVSAAKLGTLWIVTSRSVSGLSLGWGFDWMLLLETMRISKWAFGDDLSHRIAMNTEPVVLGAMSSFGQVALFGVGGRLPAHLFQFAARGMSVLLPDFSRHHAEADTERLRSIFSKVLRVCLTGMVPPVMFAAICAPALMTIWAGQAYRAAAPVLVWLLISSLSMVFMLPSDMVLYSHNQVPRVARLSVLQTLGKIGVALMLAGRYGAVGVAAGVALWHWCVNLLFYLPAACRVAEIRPSELWRTALGVNTRSDRRETASDRNGSLVQAAAFLAGVLGLFSVSRVRSALELFVACVGVSILYFAIWTACTALPMWRRARAEAEAAL